MFLSKVSTAGVVLHKGRDTTGKWWYRRDGDEQNGKRKDSFTICSVDRSGGKGNKWRHGNNGNKIIKTNKDNDFTHKRIYFFV